MSGASASAQHPAGWMVLPIRRILRGLEQGWSPVAEDRGAEDGEWAVIKLSAVHAGAFRDDAHKALTAETIPDARFEIRAGDVLVTRANTPELVADACVVRHTRPHLMLCDLVYRLTLDESRCRPEFLVYWLLSEEGRAQINCDAGGSSQSMVKVSQGHIRAWTFGLPALATQETIAAFLDRRTAALDALVAKKERLIERLREKRQALITEAVTRGLDPNAPTKDSGVDWLPTIPASWRMVRNGGIFRERDARGRGDLPVMSVSIESGVQLRDLDEDRIRWTMSDFDDYKVALAGDVVFNKMRMWQGAVGVAPVDGLVSPDYTVLEPRPDINPRYFMQVCRTEVYKCLVGRYSHGIVMDRNRIYWSEFKALHAPVPPRQEQDAIVAYMDAETARIDRATEKLTTQIARLREYRQALITEAVTGKIPLARMEAAVAAGGTR